MAEGEEIGGGFASAEDIKKATENIKEYRKALVAAAGVEEEIAKANEKLDLLSVSILEKNQEKLKIAEKQLKVAERRMQAEIDTGKAEASTLSRMQKNIELRDAAIKARKNDAITLRAEEEKLAVEKRKLLTENFLHEDKLRAASTASKEKDGKVGLKVIADTAKGSVETVKQMGVVLGSVLKSPELAAAMMFPGLTVGIKDIERQITRMPAQLDSAIAGMVKKTALPVKQLGDTLVNALDPEYARRIGVEFGNIPAPLKDIGLKAKDVAGAMESLVGNMAMFRPSFMQSNKAAAAFLTNTVAGMGKLGVKTGTSAKILDTFTKALKKTPVEAGKSLKSIANVADSLGLSMGKVMDNFSAMTPKLSMFGDDMIEVFADLQAQAQGTGVEMSKLLGVAMKMDTFEGAAKHAQTLNAVLGQSAISVTDLVHADPADKIAMIQDAIANAGIDFETADRRMRQVIATAAGFESVEDAAKVLLNKEDAEEAADAVDTATMSQAEFSKKVNQSLTTAEKMTKSLSSMAGGMKKILNTVQPGAVRFSKTMSNAFGEIQKKTGDSAASVLAFTGGIKTIVATKESAKEALKSLGEGLTGLGAGAPVWIKNLFAIGAVGAGLAGTTVLGKGVIEGVTSTDLPDFEENPDMVAPDSPDTAAATKLRTERERAMAEGRMTAEAPDAPPVQQTANLHFNLDGEELDKRTLKFINGQLQMQA